LSELSAAEWVGDGRALIVNNAFPLAATNALKVTITRRWDAIGNGSCQRAESAHATIWKSRVVREPETRLHTSSRIMNILTWRAVSLSANYLAIDTRASIAAVAKRPPFTVLVSVTILERNAFPNAVIAQDEVAVARRLNSNSCRTRNAMANSIGSRGAGGPNPMTVRAPEAGLSIQYLLTSHNTWDR